MSGLTRVTKKYWRYAALAIQETIAYRTAYVINVVSAAIAYVVIFFVWNAVYAGRAQVGGFSWADMKAYLLISLFTGALISGFSEFRIARGIRNGNVVVDLLRPVSFQGANLAVTVGNSLTEGALAAVLMVAFVFAVGLVGVPGDPVTWAAFVVALVLSYLTKFLTLYLFSLFCFWTNSFMGLNWLRRGLTDFFSGAVIPLAFFPDWLLGLANALPFKGIVALPAGIWIGQIRGPDLVWGLGLQLVWVLVLWWGARGVWALAMRKVTIQGG